MNEKKLLSGNEAVAYGAWEAGVEVACSYPGTPSSEILETLQKFEDVKALWCVNEKVAVETAAAAAIAGKRALASMKHVGLNVAADPLVTLAYTGINAGFVIVTCDDPGMYSSQNEQDNRWYSIIANIPLIEPAEPSEAHDWIKEAFEISEKYDLPVLFRMTTRLSHSKAPVKIDTRKIARKNWQKNSSKYVMIPSNARKRRLDLNRRWQLVREYAETTRLNREEGSGEPVYITSGVPYLFLKEQHPNAHIIKLGLTNPLPEKKIKNLKRIKTFEELTDFLFTQVRKINPDAEPIIFKEKQIEDSLPKRPPVFCPGCPYRAVFYVLSKFNVNITGDIGCYSLGVLPPFNAMDTLVCMGASISFLEGFKLADEKRTVAVIGDSTFFHTGIPALLNMSWHKIDGVVLILDNSTTAMTGHQPTPGNKVRLEDIPKAFGINNVTVVNPFELKKFEATLKNALENKDTAVVIARAPCALLSEKKTPVKVNHEKCKACGICKRIACPAIIFEGEKPRIDESLCNGCGLCVEICPFGAIEQ